MRMRIRDPRTLEPISSFDADDFFRWFVEGLKNIEQNERRPFGNNLPIGSDARFMDEIVDLFLGITNFKPDLAAPFEQGLVKILENTEANVESIKLSDFALELGRRIKSVAVSKAAQNLADSEDLATFDDVMKDNGVNYFTRAIIRNWSAQQEPQKPFAETLKNIYLTPTFNRAETPILFITMLKHSPERARELYELTREGLEQAPGDPSITRSRVKHILGEDIFDPSP